MILKDVTNFLLLKEYIYERNQLLHCFEDLIIQGRLKYFLEPQIFFFLKDDEMCCDVFSLKDQYVSFLKAFTFCDMQIAQYNCSKQIWMCSNQIVGWKKVINYKLGKEFFEWEPCYGKVWKCFPNGLFLDSDYKILYSDDFVDIVLFYKKLQMNTVCTNERKVLQYSYHLSCQNSCDIFYEAFEDVSYSFLNNQETMSCLGIQEYFKWLRIYEEEVTRKLTI